MSHCISVYLINRLEVRNDKIDYIINGESIKIKWTELGENILANIREYGKDKTIAKITTDYFGGFGEQTAKLFINNKRVFNKSNESAINDVLKMMGVVSKNGLDEFDTIGLGKYRSNECFNT